MRFANDLRTECIPWSHADFLQATLIRWLAALVGCLAICSTTWAARNVVLFIVDDMSQTAGCYGSQVVQTPNLDQLAAAGTLYTDAFCTTASCSPSRAVILSGLHSHANGQLGLAHAAHNFVSRDTFVSLPTLMRKAGYRTARIGRSVHVRPPEQYEFDLTLPQLDGPPSMEQRLYGRDVMRCVDDARDFITSNDRRPYFLMFCTADAHRLNTRFDDKPGHPNAFGNDHHYRGVHEVHYSPEQIEVPPFLTDNVETRAELAEHYQALSRVDQGLGALVKVLKETGHWDDTLLIFISDHGMPFPGAKTTVYEPGLRCPCIVRSPESEEQGVVSDAMISWVDITPTILDYADATPEQPKFHGRSLLPTVGQPHTPGWDKVFASHTFHEVTMYYPMRVVRTRRHKLIWNIAWQLEYPIAADLWDSSTWQAVLKDGPNAHFGLRTVKQYCHRPEFELYDLEHDPQEIHNLANDPDHKHIFDELLVDLKEFQQATDDPWRIKWIHE